MTISAARQHRSGKRGDTVRLLLDACVAELVARGYADLSVRSVAARAGVAPATAYTYFSSKEHLVAEVFWRRMSHLPEPASQDPAEATAQIMRAVSLLMADEPALAGACTVAMLSEDPDVVELRGRIGMELHSRLMHALGPDLGEPVALRVGIQWAGAMLYAGLGHLSYDDVADILVESTALLLQVSR